MTVRELIAELQRRNQDALVYLESNGLREPLAEVARAAFDDMGDPYPIDALPRQEDAVILR